HVRRPRKPCAEAAGAAPIAPGRARRRPEASRAALASSLHRTPRVTPTIHDVVGTPAPGSGLARRPPERGAAFRGVIESLLQQHGASRSAPAHRTGATHHVRSTLPARGLRTSHGTPHTAPSVHGHAAALARTRAAATRAKAVGAAGRA